MKISKFCGAMAIGTFVMVQVASGQNSNETLKAAVMSKTIVAKSDTSSEGPGTLNIGRDNSGIVVKQNKDGILFKSYLHDYPEVHIELMNRNREILYQYTNEMKKNVDYNLSVNNLPKGEYILNFEYENMLVVCNIQVMN